MRLSVVYVACIDVAGQLNNLHDTYWMPLVVRHGSPSGSARSSKNRSRRNNSPVSSFNDAKMLMKNSSAGRSAVSGFVSKRRLKSRHLGAES